jgi:hypothetical protein
VRTDPDTRIDESTKPGNGWRMPEPSPFHEPFGKGNCGNCGETLKRLMAGEGTAEVVDSEGRVKIVHDGCIRPGEELA